LKFRNRLHRLETAFLCGQKNICILVKLLIIMHLIFERVSPI